MSRKFYFSPPEKRIKLQYKCLNKIPVLRLKGGTWYVPGQFLIVTNDFVFIINSKIWYR